MLPDLSKAQLRIYVREVVIYGLCGFGTLFIFIAFVGLCEKVAPAHVAASLPEAVRARNLIDFQVIAFFPANLFAWWTNRTFVFRGKKHSLGKELLIFFTIAALSFVLGLIAPIYLVREYAVSNTVANLALAFLSACWNFILRRVFVFGGQPLDAR